MLSNPQPAMAWKTLFRVPGFPFFFTAMLVSLFGTGMNFAGVTWYILGETNSTVKLSVIVILVTFPGIVVPPFWVVIFDRVDRRFLVFTAVQVLALHLLYISSSSSSSYLHPHSSR